MLITMYSLYTVTHRQYAYFVFDETPIQYVTLIDMVPCPTMPMSVLRNGAVYPAI